VEVELEVELEVVDNANANCEKAKIEKSPPFLLKYLEVSKKCCIFVVEKERDMNKTFEIGQYIVKKMRPVNDVTVIPMIGMMAYSRSDTPAFGVFRVDPYVKGDYEAPFDYKVTLTPVGKSAEIFLDEDFYTSDLRDTPAEMVFDDQSLAEKFMDMLK
jgi:hypothetical protein